MNNDFFVKYPWFVVVIVVGIMIMVFFAPIKKISIPGMIEIELESKNGQKIPQTSGNHEVKSLALNSDVEADYRNLQKLLQSRNLKEADEETTKLILIVANKETQKILSSQDWETFACTDLKTIDQLWLFYSEDRFGFSIQKRILEEVGKDYKQFATRVRWQENNRWVDSNELSIIYQFNAPKGHLPADFLKHDVKLYGFQWENSVYSRLDSCKKLE